MFPLIFSLPFRAPIALQSANKVGGAELDAHQLRDRLAMLSDDDALFIHMIEKGEALYLKLGCADGAHVRNIAHYRSFSLTGHVNLHFPSTENASSTFPGIPPMAP
jgi:hypothetical protein